MRKGLNLKKTDPKVFESIIKKGVISRVGASEDMKDLNGRKRDYEQENIYGDMYFIPTEDMKTTETEYIALCKKHSGCWRNIYEISSKDHEPGFVYGIKED